MRGNEESRLAGRKGSGHFNCAVHRIFLAAVKAKAALRNIFTLDDVVGMSGMADTGAEVDTHAHVPAAIGGAAVGVDGARRRCLCFSRWRRGKRG